MVKKAVFAFVLICHGCQGVPISPSSNCAYRSSTDSDTSAANGFELEPAAAMIKIGMHRDHVSKLLGCGAMGGRVGGSSLGTYTCVYSETDLEVIFGPDDRVSSVAPMNPFNSIAITHPDGSISCELVDRRTGRKVDIVRQSEIDVEKSK